MDLVIFDIDGVLFDPTDRLNRCKNADGLIDWNRAFSNIEVIQDPMLPNANLKANLIMRMLAVGVEYPTHYPDCLYLTGRSRQCELATNVVIMTNVFPYGNILMRADGDTRPDAEVKAELIDKYQGDWHYHIIAAVDDDYNGTLVPMYASKGIPHYKSLDAYLVFLSKTEE